MSIGRAVIGGLEFFGYNERIRDAFLAEGWDCKTLETWYPPYDRRVLANLLFGILPRRFGVRGPLEWAMARARRLFVDAVLRTEFDLLLVIRPDFLTVEDLDEIRRARPSAVVACWLMDSLAYHPRFLDVVEGTDRVFSFDEADLPRLGEKHPRVRFLPLAFDPGDYSPAARSPAARWRVSFIGAPHLDRLRLLERLCDELSLKPDDVRFVIGAWKVLPIIGQRSLNRRSWLYRDGFLDLETTDHPACREIYQRSDVCLNVHQPFNPTIPRGFNMRVFEICGAGGFQLVEALPGLDRVFPEDTGLSTYRDSDGLIASIRDALAAPERRRDAAQRCAEHAHAHHTFRHRVREIVDHCEVG